MPDFMKALLGRISTSVSYLLERILMSAGHRPRSRTNAAFSQVK